MGNSCFHKRHAQEISLKLSLGSTNIQQLDNYPEAFNQGKQIQYKLGELIAEGRFCKIYQCINLKSGELLTLKSYPTSRSSSNFIQEIKKIKKEAAILKVLSHKNIIKLHQIESSTESVDMLMECIPGGCLEEILNKYGSLEEDIAKNYLKQLIEALLYLNSQNISHNNLHCQSVFITSDGIVKLSGFKNFTYFSGSAEILTSRILDNTQHLAPEALTGTVCNNSDVWSLGLLAIHMITGKPALEHLGRDQGSIIKALTGRSFDLVYPRCSKSFYHFLQACLKLNQIERPSLEELTRFELFTGKKINNEHLGEDSVKGSLSRTADCQLAIPEVDYE